MAYSTINKPSDYFNALNYDGSASENSVTGVGHQPSMLLLKDNVGTYNWQLINEVTTPAVDNVLIPNTVDAESDFNSINSIDSDGITLPGATNGTNSSGRNYMLYSWLGSGTSGGTINNDGSTQTQISVNTTSGFSIVTYAGTSSTSSLGHGLGKKPAFILTKSRNNGASGWIAWHKGLNSGSENGNYIYFNSSSGSTQGNTPSYWGSGINSTNYGVWASGGDNNRSGDNFISFVWAEIKGFSKFGRYTGNDLADGTYVNCGFKPKMVWIKRLSADSETIIYDTIRNKFNETKNSLELSSTDGGTDVGSRSIDITSSGFKIRSTSAFLNTVSNQYIYCAWAEHPLVGTNDIVTNAR